LRESRGRSGAGFVTKTPKKNLEEEGSGQGGGKKRPVKITGKRRFSQIWGEGVEKGGAITQQKRDCGGPNQGPSRKRPLIEANSANPGRKNGSQGPTIHGNHKGAIPGGNTGNCVAHN